MIKNLIQYLQQVGNPTKPNKVMSDILNEIEPKQVRINYQRKDGKTNEYTVVVTEHHPDHIKGYKYDNGESHGIRRFNRDQINSVEAY